LASEKIRAHPRDPWSKSATLGFLNRAFALALAGELQSARQRQWVDDGSPESSRSSEFVVVGVAADPIPHVDVAIDRINGPVAHCNGNGNAPGRMLSRVRFAECVNPQRRMPRVFVKQKATCPRQVLDFSRKPAVQLAELARGYVAIPK
jgi:hypothetical protein